MIMTMHLVSRFIAPIDKRNRFLAVAERIPFP